MIYPWTIALLILTGSLVFGYVLKQTSLPILSSLLRRFNVETKPGESLALSRYLVLWMACLGVELLPFFVAIPPEHWVKIHKTLDCILIFSVGLALADFLIVLLREKMGRGPIDLPATTLTVNLVRILVMIIAILMVFSILGIAIAPLLTALGIGSLAVALGLQDTLSNLFAGIYILTSRIIQIGDYIKLETGQEGFVVDVGLRTIHLKTLSSMMIYVPTAKASQSVLTNLAHPTPDFSTPVEVHVDYGNDLEKVEQVTLETAKDVMEKMNAPPDQQPATVRFHSFGDSGIEFTVYLRAPEINLRLLLVHEFIKALTKNYRDAGIRFSLPQRVVHMSQI